ncbi:MAG: hypothetical protein ABIK96_14605 [bacterium]|nr:hypothetical protein [bacterium]
MRRWLVILMVTAPLILWLAGCAPGGGDATENEPAGFFKGIWHGWIAPVTLVWGFFDRSIRIYEPLNTGWWYDLGYYMAVVGGFGGLSLVRGRKKGRKR